MSGIKPITISSEAGEKYLKERSKEVENFDEILKWRIDILRKYVNEYNIYASSGVQIGMSERIVFVKSLEMNHESDFNREGKVLINPKIVEKRGLTTYWEICSCCGNLLSKVRRPYEIVVEYQDIDGFNCLDFYQGFESTIISHEIDHLDGILPIDIADEIIEVDEKEKIKIRENDPYTIINKELNYDNQLVYSLENNLKRKRIKH